MTAPAQSSADRDERLAKLLDELTSQLRQGQRVDLDAICRQHPDLAGELRELWGAAQVAEELGRPSLHRRSTIDMPLADRAAAAELPAPASLPRSFGDYELLQEIGRGGMGVVYKATQKSLNRTVALKMILRGELASAADLARFRAEAESAAHLEHPNIIPVYEVGGIDGYPYFSMKYVEGKTLAQRVAEGPLPPRDAARLVAAIARGVDHAHQHGIVHRDLKPSNVLLASGGRESPGDGVSPGDSRPPLAEFAPLITDFGLAKRVEGGASLTRTGAIVGTPSYMSPEQAAGSRGEIGPASDVYSLGAILYELLTGRPPFQAPSAVGTIMLVLEQEPVPPRRLNPGVDRELEMICLKCLQKPVDLRYATAGKLADDLEAFLKGEPIAARPSGMAYIVANLLRETHQAGVLENWGVLWMWHSLVLLILCTATQALSWYGVTNIFPFLAIWIVGLGTWASIFWALRRNLGGPVTFVEREIAHVWAASTLGSISLFGVELLLQLPVLKLSPVLAVLAGMVFLVKAGMLSGWFYLASAACFVTAVLMALFPQVGLLLFGSVSAACFFYPGLKYYRQRQEALRETSASKS
jgi:serine/threonine-protein kinase